MYISENVISKWRKAEKDEFILRLVTNFGKTNKIELEVELFHLLLKCHYYETVSDYKLSTELQIPESKVKRLRYEESIRYLPEEAELKKRAFNYLTGNSVKFLSEKLQVSIPDKILRAYINDILTSGGRFYEQNSLNTNVITVSAADLFFLLGKLGNVDNKSITKQIKKNIDSSTFPKTFMEVFKNFAGDVAKGTITSVSGDMIFSLFKDVLPMLTK